MELIRLVTAPCDCWEWRILIREHNRRAQPLAWIYLSKRMARCASILSVVKPKKGEEEKRKT